MYKLAKALSRMMIAIDYAREKNNQDEWVALNSALWILYISFNDIKDDAPEIPVTVIIKWAQEVIKEGMKLQ
jgi:hypothetical protein